MVRHEAFNLRKKRERDVPAEQESLDAFAGASQDAADERAERYDRLRVGAEALGRLKPQETTCLLLKAEGLSYQEIAAQTGWTYTKVNRCLTEGRRAFVARVEGIESGAECERMEPLLSALADGEASADDMAALRPHLRGCSACRATLRDYREAPRQVAGHRRAGGGGRRAGLAGRPGASALAHLRGWFELAGAQKAAAVAASTVAVAGGGAATVQMTHDPTRRERRPAWPRRSGRRPARRWPPPPQPAQPAARPERRRSPRAASRAPRATKTPAPAPAPATATPAPDAAATEPAPAPRAASTRAGRTAAAGRAASQPAAAEPPAEGEFGP